MKLSVAVITYNEAANIRRCLESVKWADEIVVIDSGSTDETIKICKEYTQFVYSYEWPGYSLQKQRAIDHSHKQWILSLDADEELSVDLQIEIKKIIRNSFFNAYKIPRKLVYREVLLKYAEGGSYKLRLFRRGCGEMDGKKVHESLVTRENVGKLSGTLYHHSFSSLEDMLRKMNAYSSLSAEEKATKRERGGVLKGLYHGCWTFLRIYLIRKAFLDGSLGFVFSFALAEGSYYRYVKLAFDHKDHVHSSCCRNVCGKSSYQKNSQ